MMGLIIIQHVNFLDCFYLGAAAKAILRRAEAIFANEAAIRSSLSTPESRLSFSIIARGERTGLGPRHWERSAFATDWVPARMTATVSWACPMRESGQMT